MPPKPRKPKAPKDQSPPPPPPVPEWDRNSKEVWHLEFEREAVNDDKWSCIVAAAVQAEDKDEECIVMYIQSVNAGLRRAVKVITMADVTALIKEHVKVRKENETSKPGKGEKNKAATAANVNVPNPSPIIELVAKYAVVTDTECQLPPDLMAAVVKFLIFKLKEENSLQKKTEAIRAKKLRERNIRTKFIREKKPFEKRQENKSFSTSQSSAFLAEAINDEPIDGPDLYIMLVGFYDIAYFQEMLKVNIPLVALLKILTTRYAKDDAVEITPPSVAEVARRRANQLTSFWEKLKQECLTLETTTKFKDVAMMQYTAPSQSSDLKEYRRVVFDELTWTLYSADRIQRQHQKYLQEMDVQRVILSLETLDLNKCHVYNKLCDALITGEPLSFLIVLYALVEQVVVGVPETQSVALEYHSYKHSTVSHARRRTLRKRRFTKISRTIFELKDKTELSPDKHKESSAHWTADWSEISVEHTSTAETKKKESAVRSREKVHHIPENEISETLLDQVLTERKTEKELKADKRWKTPFLCFHGDSVFMQTFYCDPRLFDAQKVVSRFLGNSEFFHVWNKFPELTPEEKIYYNYHFFSLWKISGEKEELLKTKIFFLLAMKFMGITKSYVYRGADENISTSLSNEKEKQKDIAKMTYDISLFGSIKDKPDSFTNYFLKTFIVDMYHRRAVMSIQDSDWESFRTESEVLMKITSHLNVFHLSRCSVPFCHKAQNVDKNFPSEPTLAKIYHTLYFLLDCLDITNLTESHFVVGNEFHLNAIKSFKFYEKLESHLMIQRVLEAAENFNTIQYWHFLPTDTLIINMHDDFDHRGLFYTVRRGTLPTPVALRDFYSYVYPEISKWLVNENMEHSKYITELAEKLKAQEEKEDAEYLAFLNQEYDKLDPEKQKEFLESLQEQQVETDEKDPIILPRKRKPPRSRKISFITTNLTDTRIENDRKINEFHSLDGTKVNVSLDNWLYQPPSLLLLEVKRSDFLLYYHQMLGQETNTSFTFKTISGIIFSFYKDNEEDHDLKYYVTMSWPTGLLIRPIWTDSTVYVKQFYLKPCRKISKTEEEESRCFLKNGNLVVFKSNGDYDVLCASGTKYSFYDSSTIPRYEIVSTTGEVWEIRTKGPCRNRKKLTSRNKIFIGVDPKTHEAFYKREDGVQCMLWQSGRLVTKYPDGTKITSTPYFDEEEVNLEWTEEEKNYFEQLVYRYKSEQSVHEPRSRTILRRSSTSRTIEAKSFEFEAFISISCAYLTEHPKYSTVHVNRTYPYLRVTLPENLSIIIREEGAYEVQKDKHFLKVEGTEVVFQTICYDCPDTSTIKLNLDSSDILCSFVDFFRKAFYAHRNGAVTFHENQKDDDTPSDHRSNSTFENAFCASRQVGRSTIAHHRCFVLERDLSGIEFLHEDYVADHIARHSAPDPHHLLFHSDLRSEDGEYAGIGHTLSGQYSKANYEKWVMDYEDPLDSLPTNIKKKDLKELGTKQVTKNLFQYPFPKGHNCGQQPKEKVKKNVNPPKLIVSRTILCLSPIPNSIITELKKHVMEYQKQALKIFSSYKNKKPKDERERDPRHIEMRLRKIAITLNQSLHMYPHLCSQLPSTEKDIHYFGHLINKAQELKFQPQDDMHLLPECKQIPFLPRFHIFESIPEENETQLNSWI